VWYNNRKERRQNPSASEIREMNNKKITVESFLDEEGKKIIRITTPRTELKELEEMKEELAKQKKAELEHFKNLARALATHREANEREIWVRNIILDLHLTVEYYLNQAIELYFGPFDEREKLQFSELLKNIKFKDKIQLLKKFNLLNSKEFNKLDNLNEIRNEFAHRFLYKKDGHKFFYQGNSIFDIKTLDSLQEDVLKIVMDSLLLKSKWHAANRLIKIGEAYKKSFKPEELVRKMRGEA